ncbi:ABC transporter ATP-binding protein, partial [Neisseria sp. P0016.S005]
LKQSGAQILYIQQGHGSLETFYLDFLRKDEPATDKQNPQ